jgi:hypothetical protein
VPWVNNEDWPEFFMLYPDTSENRALAAGDDGFAPYIAIAPYIIVSPSGGCPPNDAPDGVDVDVAGLAEYLATRDDVVMSDPVIVTIGGLSGQQIDVGLEPGSAGCLPGPNDEDSTSDHYRFIVLDRTAGSSLFIKLSPALTDLDSFLAAAMPVVESFQFDTGQ